MKNEVIFYLASIILILSLLTYFIPYYEITGSFIKIESTCNKGDGCNKNCVNGDPDCSCEAQKGYLCKENENCKTKLLLNWGSKACCSTQCLNGTINGNNTSIKLFQTEKSQVKITAEYQDEKIKEDNTRNYLKIGLMSLTLLLLVILAVIFRRKPKNVTILNIKPKENVNKEENELLETVKESLSDEEKSIINEISKKEGRELEELMKKLKLSKEKISFYLLKLERRQIVKTKGTTNPRIFINDWLK